MFTKFNLYMEKMSPWKQKDLDSMPLGQARGKRGPVSGKSSIAKALRAAHAAEAASRWDTTFTCKELTHHLTFLIKRGVTR